MPTQEELRALYDYQDGHLIRKTDKKRVGAINGGYLKFLYKKKRFQVHRAVWIWHNGPIPLGLMIDHIDRARLNNRIQNLRLATASMNALNRTPGERVWRGAKGLHWHQREQMWRAVVKNKGKATYLGMSKDPHRLIWLLHLYRVGIFVPKPKLLVN